MHNTVIKLKDILGREVDAREAADVVEHLLACLTYVTNSRPLFGVLNTRTAALEWTAGGADFHDVFQHLSQQDAMGATGILSFMQLFMCFGISSGDVVAVVEQMKALEPGASLSLAHPMVGAVGAHERYFRMVLRRRREPNEGLVQFSLLDITAFQASAKRAQNMAQALVAELSAPMGPDVDSQGGASARLLAVLDGLDTLFGLHDDDAIQALAQDLSQQVTAVSERMVTLLRGFEQRFETSHWQPDDNSPPLRPVISVHSTPVSDWQQLHQQILLDADPDGDGEPALTGLNPHSVKHAYDFVRHATSTLVISPVAGTIFLLNGNEGGKAFSTVDELVRALGVEENSTHTATDYFAGLGTAPALGLFAMEGHNVEAWGRPGLYGGWQAMLVPAQGTGVDVRGLFHGLKNLLLHLQVLYVVNHRGDVDQVLAGLSDTAVKIRGRLSELAIVARTGRRTESYRTETLSQWLDAAVKVGDEVGGDVIVVADGLANLRLSAMSGEMEDTFEELARNAFIHGAKTLRIGAMVHAGHLCILIRDDGKGMSDAKLAQLRDVLHSGNYDASLSTRKDGTGDGLLSAANAVTRFVDGRISVNHASADAVAGARGVEFKISLKIPK